jgi:hypothetical protein
MPGRAVEKAFPAKTRARAALLPAKAIWLGHLSPRLVARRRAGMPVHTENLIRAGMSNEIG